MTEQAATGSPGGFLDGVRLAVGTFTVLRVRPPSRVDRGVARTAILLAPVVGAALAVIAAMAGLAVRYVASGPDSLAHLSGSQPRITTANVLAAALTISVLALLTRGLHLDGLADTADGLASGRPADEALEVMRRGDVGALGAATLMLTLLVQVAALATVMSAHHGSLGVVTAVVTGRLAIVWACLRGIPAARPGGLGAAVAGVVPRLIAFAWTLAVLGLAGALVLLDDDETRRQLFFAPLAVLVGLAVAFVLLRRCVRRFGGVTGDVLGAVCEVATAGALLALAAG